MKQSQRTGSKGAQVVLYSRGIVVLAFHEIVTGHDPYSPSMGKTHLGRAEHVAGGMKGELHAVVDDLLPVAQRIQPDARQARIEHRFARVYGEIVRVPRAGMVAVPMREHGAVDRTPGIDVEIARRAVQPLGTGNDEIGRGGWHRGGTRCRRSAYGAARAAPTAAAGLARR